MLIASELEAWRQLVFRCRKTDDGPVEFVRPIRGLGSEFLGKRSPVADSQQQMMMMACPFDDVQLCLCIQKQIAQEDGYYQMPKRGLGAIFLSGSRMTQSSKWPGLYGLQRRQMGSEFLGKRAAKNGGTYDFPGKKASSSRTGGMGNEFLGKRSGGEVFGEDDDDILPASHQY